MSTLLLMHHSTWIALTADPPSASVPGSPAPFHKTAVQTVSQSLADTCNYSTHVQDFVSVELSEVHFKTLLLHMVP